MRIIRSLFLVLAFGLMGCQMTQSTTTPTTTTTTTGVQSSDTTTTSVATSTSSIGTTTTSTSIFEEIVETYAEGVEFHLSATNEYKTFPEAYIGIDFTRVTYSPIQNRICAAYTVNDTRSANASYFAILQQLPSTLTRTQVQFFGVGPSFAAGACFDIPDRSLNYRIVIGKYDHDNLNRVPGKIEVSAMISWTDSQLAGRNTISYTPPLDETEADSGELANSSVGFRFVLEDPDDTIETLRVYLIESLGNVVATREYATESLRTNGIITLHALFDNLAPGAKYKAMIYADGSDGLDPFENEYLTSIELQAALVPVQSPMGPITAFHVLYAVIYDVEYTDTEAVIHYFYKNDELIKYSNNGEILRLLLEYRSSTGTVLRQIAMSVGDQTFRIPLDQIAEGNRFVVVDQRRTQTFSNHLIIPLTPRFDFIQTEPGVYQLQFTGSYDHLESFEIKVFVPGYAVAVEEILLTEFTTSQEIRLYHDFASIDKEPYMQFVITYWAYGKKIVYESIPL